ncbi:hypothetical protein GCM10023314_01610 [Algibacter agarivorans]|uniref:Uncharacterized protein n=1 Tax=Algibacter agarivorans TaxID=1109741 RepID=A0ABP9G921_9FLAO
MLTRKIYTVLVLIISSLDAFSQQGAYHDAMMEEQESGGQFGFITGLIVIIALIYFATKSD